jgi:hypothetical protein
MILKKTMKATFEKIELTLQEIWAATRPNVYKSKKTYSRKDKHKKKGPNY